MNFPQDVLELIAYMGDPQPDQPVRAVPGMGSKVPVWILGSSLYGASARGARWACLTPSPRISRPSSWTRRWRCIAQQFRPSAFLGASRM